MQFPDGSQVAQDGQDLERAQGAKADLDEKERGGVGRQLVQEGIPIVAASGP